MNELQREILLGIQQKQANIENQKANLGQLRTQKQVDLRPLMNIADMVAGDGSNMARNYQGPQDNSLKVQALSQQLSQQEQGLTGDKIRLLAAMNAGKKEQSIAKTLTPGQKKADEAFGKDYSEWVQGGFSGTKKNLEELGKAYKDLGGENELGGVILPEFIRKRTNPESVVAQQKVHGVAVASLKKILGSQFTEKEGERIMNLSYDPALSDDENQKKIQTTMGMLQEMATAKQSAVEYFRTKGTLRGYEGSNASNMEEFMGELKNKYMAPESTPNETNYVDMSDDELLKQYQAAGGQ